MPRELTQTAAQAILARETAEVLLDCLTLWGEGMPTFRLVLNTEPLTRADGVYQPFEFNAPAPDDDEQLNASLQVQISNAAPEIRDILRDYTGVPYIRVETVLASEPNTIIHGPFEFAVANVDLDELFATLQCGQEEDFLNQQVPAQSYTPNNSPGLYL